MSDKTIDTLATILEDTDYDWSHAPGVETGADAYKARATATIAALKAQRIAVIELPEPNHTTERGDLRWPSDGIPVWTTSEGVSIGGIERDSRSARTIAAAILAAADKADAAEAVEK